MSDFINRYFSKEDLDRLETAIGDAERKTEGEIAMVITQRSSAGWHHGWLIAGRFGLLVAVICLALTYHSDWGITFDYALATAVGVGAFVLVLGWWLIRRARSAASKQVWNKALERFARLQPTRGKTGVLLYVSLEERQVAVVADVAIAGKLAADYWDGPRDRMIGGFRSGRPTDAMIEAVQEIGVRLAEHFPRRADDTNELPNRPVLD